MFTFFFRVPERNPPATSSSCEFTVRTDVDERKSNVMNADNLFIIPNLFNYVSFNTHKMLSSYIALIQSFMHSRANFSVGFASNHFTFLKNLFSLSLKVLLQKLSRLGLFFSGLSIHATNRRLKKISSGLKEYSLNNIINSSSTSSTGRNRYKMNMYSLSCVRW